MARVKKQSFEHLSDAERVVVGDADDYAWRQAFLLPARARPSHLGSSRLPASSAFGPPIQRTREVLVYANRYLQVYDDEVIMPDGTPGRYLRLLPGAGSGGSPSVVAVARDNLGRTAFVRIYRYGLAEWNFELPMGNGEPGETGKESALRELKEETGLTGRDAWRVGRFVADSSYDGAYIEVFMIDDVAGVAVPQTDEAIAEVRWLNDVEIWAYISNGIIVDGVTITALAIAREVNPVGGFPGDDAP
jgi:ADP-ribose pyrophosphatase